MKRTCIIRTAELANTVGDWDGRVSTRVRSWASGMDGAAKPEDLESIGVYQPPEIHPAHIDNLASYCMRVDIGREERR